MAKNLQISGYVLDMMIHHAEQDYPNETCGIILGPKNKKNAIGVFPIKNIQDELHAKEPRKYTRSAATAYFMDPRQVRVVERA